MGVWVYECMCVWVYVCMGLWVYELTGRAYHKLVVTMLSPLIRAPPPTSIEPIGLPESYRL